MILQGVSAREITSYFFEYDTRLEWESTIESATILEALSEDTIVFHQLHKRVWPSTQRETVFCSHICTLPNAPREENQVGHTWMVGNFSVDHPAAPVSVTTGFPGVYQEFARSLPGVCREFARSFLGICKEFFIFWS